MKVENEKFFYKVIEELDYYDWKLEWYKDDSSEGYCCEPLKIIYIGPANENVKRLILHEIAHINTCLNGNRHRTEFWLKYEKLLEKYLQKVELSDGDKYYKKLYCE